MKKQLLYMVQAFMLLPLFANAQSILDNLTFEAPQKMVRPINKSLAAKQRPNANAKNVTTISKSILYPVVGENAQWYIIRVSHFSDSGWHDFGDCWVKKTSVREEQAKPIMPNMLNRFFGYGNGYDDCMQWMVSTPIGSHGFALLLLDDRTVFLGKQLGNIFVFKYIVDLYIIDDVGPGFAPNQWKIEDEDDGYGGTTHYTYFGKYFYKQYKHGQFMAPSVDLTKFTDELMEAIFKGEILKNNVKYLYVTSEQLSGSLSNYELG